MLGVVQGSEKWNMRVRRSPNREKMGAHELQGYRETQVKGEPRAGMSGFQLHVEIHIKD